MLKHYLKSTFRNLSRNKGYSLINILGLALGMACFSLFYLYLQHEHSFDTFLSEGDQAYRIISINENQEEGLEHVASSPFAMGKALTDSYAEIEAYTTVLRLGQMVIEHKGEMLNERDWFVATPDFFKVFPFEMIEGDRDACLSEPYTVVITQSFAKKLYAEESPIGKVLNSSRRMDLKITGVIPDPPKNSHLQFNMIISVASLSEQWEQLFSQWGRRGGTTYIRATSPEVSLPDTAAMTAFVQQHIAADNELQTAYFQPFLDVHFHSNEIDGGLEENKGSLSLFYIFIAISAFILLIAAINYMNLATARAFQRAKEIGLRKVVGATRSQLINQILGEALLITLLATLLSILIFDLCLPYFNELTGKQFRADGPTLMTLSLPLAITCIGVGLFSGIIPALSISSFQPVQILRNQLQSGKKAQRIRQALVITQFSLSIIMIVSTLVVYQQLQFVQNKELGFKKDFMVVVDINSGAARGNFEAMKTAFVQHPDILNVSSTSRVPGEWKGITQIDVAYVGGQDSMESLFFCGDENMLDVFEIELIQGRNFSGNPLADSLNCIINETAAKRLGLEQPIGQKLFISGIELRPTIIGVVKDFHVKSLHEPIGPLLIGAWKNPVRPIDYFSMQISSSNVEATLAHIENVQKEFDPATPLEYHFLDDQIELFYEQDRRTGKVFAIGALLTILIACLGLLGLAAYTVERRTKEIGIRKVMGASTSEVVLMLVRHFAIQVGIAFVIASPIAWYLMSEWLQNFSYKQDLNISLFFLAGLIALVISVATVSYRSFQAARTNPIQALREN